MTSVTSAGISLSIKAGDSLISFEVWAHSQHQDIIAPGIDFYIGETCYRVIDRQEIEYEMIRITAVICDPQPPWPPVQP